MSWSLERIREELAIEQILAALGIPIHTNNKIICPFHRDHDPSMLVNEKYVYCFSCQRGWGNFMFVLEYKRKSDPTVDVGAVFDWFNTTTFPKKTDRVYESAKYEGAVAPTLINFWHNQLTQEHYDTLYRERLLLPKTIQNYKLGWRNDWKAWVIPFKTDVGYETVQFRLTSPDAKSKYVGLKGHQRGSVMNQWLLNKPLPYVAVLLGSFDGILAHQDGIFAVGTNGASPFSKDDKPRVQELFSKQSNVIVVPDNTPSEFQHAYRLAGWVNGRVAFYPSDTPPDTDYISWRLSGRTAEEFIMTVLGQHPKDVNPDLVDNLVDFVTLGDRYNFAPVHVEHLGRNVTPQAIAQAVHQRLNIKGEWNTEAKRVVDGVNDRESLYAALAECRRIYSYSKGGW